MSASALPRRYAKALVELAVEQQAVDRYGEELATANALLGREELLRQLSEAARGRARIPVDVHLAGNGELPPAVKVAYYYVAQEALNNVAKHARANCVRISLHANADGTLLSIQDDGQGFDLAGVTPELLGLAIRRERADAIGARLTIDSVRGGGTQVTLFWNQSDRPLR